MPYGPVRVSPQSVPGLLERVIVAAEVQAVLLPYEREAVGGCVAGVLQVVLAELLRRSHIQRTHVHVGYFPHWVLEHLPAGVRGQQTVVPGNVETADQRILEFAHYGVRLVVLKGCGKTHHAALRPDFKVQGEGLAGQRVIIQAHGIRLP